MGVHRDIAYHSIAHPIDASQYAGLLRSPLVRGGAVTGQGLKTSIIEQLDHVERTAAGMGAVNTVVNLDGALHGYNTDAYGLKLALNKNFESSGIRPKNAIVYGNGGVSGVAVHVLRELEIDVTMTGRNQAHVAAKMAELQLTPKRGPFDLVVNATPISSDPVANAQNLLPALANARMVFDHSMPEKLDKANRLEAYCRDSSIHFAPGRDMYVPQMLKQWALFLRGLSGSDGQPYNVNEQDIVRAWGL